MASRELPGTLSTMRSWRGRSICVLRPVYAGLNVWTGSGWALRSTSSFARGCSFVEDDLGPGRRAADGGREEPSHAVDGLQRGAYGQPPLERDERAREWPPDELAVAEYEWVVWTAAEVEAHLSKAGLKRREDEAHSPNAGRGTVGHPRHASTGRGVRLGDDRRTCAAFASATTHAGQSRLRRAAFRAWRSGWRETLRAVCAAERAAQTQRTGRLVGASTSIWTRAEQTPVKCVSILVLARLAIQAEESNPEPARAPAIPASNQASNRGARIRTGDLGHPKAARYQAAPRPDTTRVEVDAKNNVASRTDAS